MPDRRRHSNDGVPSDEQDQIHTDLKRRLSIAKDEMAAIESALKDIAPKLNEIATTLNTDAAQAVRTYSAHIQRLDALVRDYKSAENTYLDLKTRLEKISRL